MSRNTYGEKPLGEDFFYGPNRWGRLKEGFSHSPNQYSFFAMRVLVPSGVIGYLLTDLVNQAGFHYGLQHGFEPVINPAARVLSVGMIIVGAASGLSNQASSILQAHSERNTAAEPERPEVIATIADQDFAIGRE
jgi:hypothetical protein